MHIDFIDHFLGKVSQSLPENFSEFSDPLDL
jgi:hypothetical protein